MSKILIII